MAVASSELPSTERRSHYKALLDLGWEGDWGSGEFEGENGNRRIFHGVAICHSIHAKILVSFFLLQLRDGGGQWAGINSGGNASVQLGGGGRWWHIRRLGAAGDGEDDGAGASRRHRPEKKERGEGAHQGRGASPVPLTPSGHPTR
uniref:Uncharacterized protein n=1 Tax=Oryza glaberrima TaxID=4538 RepID=I1R0E3_ORYGL